MQSVYYCIANIATWTCKENNKMTTKKQKNKKTL